VARDRGVVADAVAAIVGIGFCGALTTFSGWMALVDGALRERPVRTALRALVRDVVAPLAVGVLLTVLVFAVLAG
jgi:fluoride ion exporter CrcB/FEX